MKPFAATTIKAGSRWFVLSVLGLVSLLAQANPLRFDIPAQPLPEALKVFAEQAKMQLLYKPDAVSSGTSNAVVGDFDKRAALQMLLKGTGLEVVFSKGNAATVRPVEVASKATAAAVEVDSTLQLARADQEMKKVEASPPASAAGQKAAEEPSDASANNEMTVTGTQIRGSAPVGSEVLTFTREDFDKAGAATAEQFLLTLPQNFGGGLTRFTNSGAAAPNVSAADYTYGSEVNLRGLGSGTTLVLIDGRRSASSGGVGGNLGFYTDISMIPLSAVERIEVMLDGGSALYGSDAIGGIVNFIMKKQYTGAETRLRMGTTTRGGGDERQLAQTLGKGWDSGNVLLSYEYYRQDSIDEDKRPTIFDKSLITVPAFASTTDVAQDTHAAYLNLRQQLSSAMSLTGTASYTQRDADYRSMNNAAPSATKSGNKEYGASAGLLRTLAGSWSAELTVGGSRKETNSHEFIDDPVLSSIGILSDSKIEHRSADLLLTGGAFSLPAGTVQAAFGANVQRDTFLRKQRQVNPASLSSTRQGDSDSRAVFSEFMVPLLSASPQWHLNQPRLALSLAGRYDDYDQYGSSVNPKIGLQWKITPSLQTRVTYSTAFKVPTITQVDPLSDFYLLLTATGATASLLPAGTTRYIYHLGTNPDLGPETSRNWSVGFDFKPERIEGFTASVTGFDIRYRNRIQSPTANIIQALSDPAFAAIRLFPTDPGFNALASYVLSGAFGYATTTPSPIYWGCPAANVAGTACSESLSRFGAIVDVGLRNLSVSHDRGLDVQLRQALQTSRGLWDFDLNATRLLERTRQVTLASPSVETLNTIFNPPDLKLRASSTYSFGPWAVTGVLNYAKGYTNNNVLPAVGVSSWTTGDLALSYQHRSASFFNGFSVLLNVINLFDQSPPRAITQYTSGTGITYDATNANPLGRVVSLSIGKQW